MKKTLKSLVGAAFLLAFVSCSNDNSAPAATTATPATTTAPADQKVTVEKVTVQPDTSKRVSVSVGPEGVNVGTKNVKVNVNTPKKRQ